MTISGLRIDLPFRHDPQVEQTEASVALRITAIALGAIALALSVMMLMGIIPIVGAVVGWSLLPVAIVLMLAGTFVSYVRKKEEEKKAPSTVAAPPEVKKPIVNPLGVMNHIKTLDILQGKAPVREGQKVRTLALEFLSNIEDICMAKSEYWRSPINDPESDQLKEFVNAARFFLENGALRKHASLMDFKAFVTALQVKAADLANTLDRKKVEMILNKHQELIDLQPKLPKWKQIDSHRWGRAIPRRLFNLYAMVDTINLLAPEKREAGRWLFHHSSALTLQELHQSIQKSCDKLKPEILKWDAYYLLATTGKSQAWMAEMGSRYLPAEKPPIGVLTIGRQGGVADHCSKLLAAIETPDAHHFIMFDDASYSGQQLTAYMEDLKDQLKGKVFDKTKHLYFVYGASLKKEWKKTIESFEFSDHNVQVHFITSYEFETIEMMLDKEKASSDLQASIKDITARTDKSLLTTQWKRPDYVSTPMFVTEGYLHLQGRDHLGGLTFDPDLTPAHIKHRRPPVHDILPPYKRK